MYHYGLIGNCQTSALINVNGSLEWLCWPRPDSPPVFGKLLDPEGGEFSISAPDFESAAQTYVPNTNILLTEVRTKSGSYCITDFCPRFEQFGRMYRPDAIFRIVEPIEGHPSITVHCRPIDGWSKRPVRAIRCNAHVRYETQGDALRIATNMPLTHFVDETPFLLTEKIYFGMTWSFALEEDLKRVSEDFFQKTRQY